MKVSLLVVDDLSDRDLFIGLYTVGEPSLKSCGNFTAYSGSDAQVWENTFLLSYLQVLLNSTKLRHFRQTIRQPAKTLSDINSVQQTKSQRFKRE